MKSPLSPLEHAAWSGFVETQGRLFGRIEAHLREGHGLTHTEFEVLLRLYFSPAGLRLHELVERSLISQSGTSRAVTRLVKAGLVSRRAAKDDGRGAQATLTAKGRRAFEGAATEHLELVKREFVGHFSADELKTMAGFWSRLTHLR